MDYAQCRVVSTQENPRSNTLADFARIQESLGHANISTTRVHDHRKR